MNDLPIIKEPEEVLLWAYEKYDNIALVTSMGRQTIIIIDMLHKMDIKIPIFTIDTGFLFEETKSLIDKVEKKYGLKIGKIKPEIELEDQSALYGPNLWQRNPDQCCYIRKTIPLNKFLQGYDAWITGIRRDQSSTRKDVNSIEYDASRNMFKINPIAYWTLEQVESYTKKNNIPYNQLFDNGYTSIGCIHCTVKSDGDERSGRWPTRGKTECGIHGLMDNWKNKNA